MYILLSNFYLYTWPI